MKKQQLAEMRTKTSAELQTVIDDLSMKLTTAYLTKSARKLQNVSMIKNFRRDLAQLKTILATKKETKKAQA